MPLPPEIRYCNVCGDDVAFTVPSGDNRERHVCQGCGEIQYQNPKIVAGCVPVWGDRILLCRRAIEPRFGLWTVPAGFMENHETVEEGAMRETREEACAGMQNVRLYGVYSLPRISQVYVMFLGDLLSEDGFGIGAESLEVRLFGAEEIPWEDLAFPVVEATLRRYLAEREHAGFSIVLDDL